MAHDKRVPLSPHAALLLSLSMVGAGVVAVGALIYGLMMQVELAHVSPFTIVGLIGYAAVWIWGLILAKNA